MRVSSHHNNCGVSPRRSPRIVGCVWLSFYHVAKRRHSKEKTDHSVCNSEVVLRLSFRHEPATPLNDADYGGSFCFEKTYLSQNLNLNGFK